jgi:hypothetical protein
VKRIDRNEKLVKLHQAVIERLLELIESKTATSSDLQLAWKILGDNGVPLSNLREEAGSDEPATSGQDFVNSLPFKITSGAPLQ